MVGINNLFCIYELVVFKMLIVNLVLLLFDLFIFVFNKIYILIVYWLFLGKLYSYI